MQIKVSIWGWKGVGVVWGHVGHVMISDLNDKSILSQFPYKYGGESIPKGENNKLSFEDTYKEEAGKPDVVFELTIQEEFLEDFTNTVKNHIARKIWDWDPLEPTQTHCARSAYEALKSGGVLIDPENRYKINNNSRNEILPNSLWFLLDELGIKPIMKQKDNLLQKIIEDNEKVVEFLRHHNLWA